MRMRMRMREIDERLKKGLDSVDQSSLFQILNFLDLNFFDFCVCVCVLVFNFRFVVLGKV